jgi:hypothetical protein
LLLGGVEETGGRRHRKVDFKHAGQPVPQILFDRAKPRSPVQQSRIVLLQPRQLTKRDHGVNGRTGLLVDCVAQCFLTCAQRICLRFGPVVRPENGMAHRLACIVHCQQTMHCRAKRYVRSRMTRFGQLPVDVSHHGHQGIPDSRYILFSLTRFGVYRVNAG